MAGTDETSKEAVAGRLRLLRKALGLSQVALCQRIGIQPNAWNNNEKARTRIRHEEAIKLVRAFGITLDWVYLGNPALMPGYLLDKMRQVEDAESSNQGDLHKSRA